MNNMTNSAFDYDKFGQSYSGHRKTDARIARYVNDALGSTKTVLNVGAGTGSYEPEDRYVAAVEPSGVMRSQRHAINRVPAIIGVAESLPFDDHSFDAAMAMVTIHHWTDIRGGLRELRRVARDRVVVMTFDPDCLDNCWTAHYFPEIVETEKSRFPKLDLVIEALGGACVVQQIPIPGDCEDGFQEAFYARPEAFLKKEVRLSQSAWGFLPAGIEDKMVKALADDLESGEWDRTFGEYRTKPSIIGSLRLIISSPRFDSH